MIGGLEDRRALVTGGAGFIGSHLVRGLREGGCDVVVIDDLSTGFRGNLPVGGVDLREASILDEAALREAVEGCDVVFHLAAMVSVPESVDDPVRCMTVNTVGTERVLLAARDAGVGRFVQASSAAVYGVPEQLPCREDQRADCRSPYAASKASAEAIAAAFARCYDISTASLRFFNIFGERQDPSSAYAAAIAAFIDAYAEGRPATVFGDGLQTRDFTYVANVVRACLLAATTGTPLTGDVINVGTGVRVTLLEVLAELARIFEVEAAVVHEPERAGDIPHSVADIARARVLLGYEPVVDLAEGLRRTTRLRARGSQS